MSPWAGWLGSIIVSSLRWNGCPVWSGIRIYSPRVTWTGMVGDLERVFSMSMKLQTLCGVFIGVGLLSGAVFAGQVAEGAKEKGYETCSPVLAKAEKSIAGDNAYDNLSFYFHDATDHHLFNSQVVVKYSNGNYIGLINTIRNKEGKCDGTTNLVFTFNESCGSMRETLFKDWKYNQEVAGLLTLELSNSKGKKNLILLPQGKGGCTAVVSEVFFNSDPKQ